MRPLLEVCVDSIESAVAAIEGTADRLEVCSCLPSGGLTPSCGLLDAIRSENKNIPLFAMIRPRPGDFCYTPSEILQMLSEIAMIKRNNLADGFVMGLLLSDGTIDVVNCKTLMEACQPLPVTFHRAFDVCSDPFAALDDLVDMGFSRILTSGQHADSEMGIEVLQMLVRKAADKIIIMPGCGVNHMNLETILRETKAKEFHSSASISIQSKMTYRKDSVSMGRESSQFTWSACDATRVKCMLEIANRFST